MAQKVSAEGIGDWSINSLTLFGALLGYALSNLLSGPVNLGIGTLAGENLTSKMLAFSILGGALLHAPGIVMYRLANLRTNNLGINAMAYATPIFSLAFLWVFSHIDVARLDYLMIGAAAIITANLLINFESEIRWGFKALLLALGTFGAVVYLRDGVFEFLGVETWNWADSGYFESITLTATVFTLLIAFRVTRLASRTSEEDNRTFSVYRKLDLLARRGVINGDVCYHILRIDQSKDAASQKYAYGKARQYIADVRPQDLNEPDSQLLSDAEANLDTLARSKQVDIHLGEVFAMGIFAAITVGLALLSRPPQLEGWTRLLVDLFAMLISAVVVFLLFHILDLQRERDERKLEPLEPRADYRHYLVRFIDTERRLPDQLLSFIVAAAIVLTYTGLLAHKWLGWFG